MINIIVARNSKKAIGKNNKLLYNIKEDLKHFQILTLGHKIVMGSKTFLSLPEVKPLKGRTNIVLTKNEEILATKIVQKHPNSFFEDLIICTDLNDLIEKYKESEEEVFIIGGAEIYKQFLPYTNRIYLTQIKDSKEGDTFFDFKKEEFELEEFEERTSSNGLVYRFENYKKKKDIV